MDIDEKVIKQLYKDEKIEKSQLVDVYKIHKANQTPLEKLVIQLKLVSRQDAVNAKAAVFNSTPYLIELDKIDKQAVEILPEEIVKKYNVICPGLTEDGKVILAMHNPEDEFASGFVQMKTGKDIYPCVSLLTDLESAIEKFYGGGKKNKLFFTKNDDKERTPQKSIPQSFTIPGLSKENRLVTTDPSREGNEIEQAASSLMERTKDDEEMNTMVDSIQQEIKALKQLTTLATELNSPMNEREIIMKILATAVNLCSAEDGSILLLDREKQSMFFKEVLGNGREKLIGTEISLTDMSIAGWVAINKIPLAVNNAKEDVRHYKEIDKKMDFETRNLACVPIKWGNSVIGVMEVVNKTNGEFDENDLEHLNIIAAQSSVVLHNKMVFDQLDRFYAEVLDLMIDCRNYHDPDNRTIRQEIAEIASSIAEQLNLPDIEYVNIGYAASLLDIGKLKTSEDNEYPAEGAEMLSKVDFLKTIVPMIKHQDERFDGTGYPDGLAGESIPLGARIIAIAKNYVRAKLDNPELDEEKLMDNFIKNFDTMLDPGLKLVFLSLFSEKNLK
jgi:HD-GYP domain-containing protein (c-di-GMP phosphodiesterase class II)